MVVPPLAIVSSDFLYIWKRALRQQQCQDSVTTVKAFQFAFSFRIQKSNNGFAPATHTATPLIPTLMLPKKCVDSGIDLACFGLTQPYWSSEGFHIEHPGLDTLKHVTLEKN